MGYFGKTLSATTILCCLGSAVCRADSIAVTPPGLAPGSQYRLVFVTADGTNGSSSDINVYNSFVSTEANGVAALVSLDTTWNAIATTLNEAIYDTIARDPGVPIYNLAGQLVASDATQNAGGLFSGSLFNPIDVNQYGGQYTSVVWTGSWYGGGNNPCYSLGTNCFGQTAIVIGWAQQTDSRWLTDYPPGWGSSAVIPMYAISGVLTAAASPEPSTMLLALPGLGLWVWFGKRRHGRARSPELPAGSGRSAGSNI